MGTFAVRAEQAQDLHVSVTGDAEPVVHLRVELGVISEDVAMP